MLDAAFAAIDSAAYAPTRERPVRAQAGMNEPGIFKGCRLVDGPLPNATKDAILAYLGKPNAAAWERLRAHAVVERTTLSEAWQLANPSASKRFPTSAELIRAMRVAVISQWAGGVVAIKAH